MIIPIRNRLSIRNTTQNPNQMFRKMIQVLKPKMIRQGVIRVMAKTLRPLPAVPAVVRSTILILVFSHLLTEASAICYEIWPQWSDRKIDPFLSPWYSNPMKIKWHIKFVCDDLCWIGTFYAFAKVAKQYSNFLFLTAIIFFCYHIMEVVMYFWNYKTSHYLYWDFLTTALLMIRGMFKPYKPETIAKIKSLF